jgi:hypothetical protein
MAHTLGSAALTYASKVNALGDEGLTLAGDINDALTTLTTEHDAAVMALDTALATIAVRDAEIARLTALLVPPFDTALYGVRVFPQYTNKVYGNHAAVLEELRQLGVKRVSGLLTPTMSPEVLAFYRTAGDLGIRLWMTCGEPGVPLGAKAWGKVRGHLTGPLLGLVEIVSGWNEPNHHGVTAAQTVDHGKQLRDAINIVNAASDQQIEVGTAQLWSGDIDAQYAYLRAMVAAGLTRDDYDWITWHLYPRPKAGSKVFDPALQVAQETTFRQILSDPDSPIFCSEAGYFTAPNYQGGSNPVTEDEKAALLPQHTDWYVSRGYKVCNFELLDDPDPTGKLREASFGDVRCPTLDPLTWTHKPSFAGQVDMLAQSTSSSSP